MASSAGRGQQVCLHEAGLGAWEQELQQQVPHNFCVLLSFQRLSLSL